MEGIDVWRLAYFFIRFHGRNAILLAAQRADTMLEAGDTEGCAVWKRVIDAIAVVERCVNAGGQECSGA